MESKCVYLETMCGGIDNLYDQISKLLCGAVYYKERGTIVVNDDKGVEIFRIFQAEDEDAMEFRMRSANGADVKVLFTGLAAYTETSEDGDSVWYGMYFTRGSEDVGGVIW